MTKVYLDSWILRGLVSKKSSQRGDAKREISKLRSHSFDVSISQIVIGETISTVFRDYDDPNDAHNILTKLYDDIMPILDASSCMPPLTMDVYQKANELKNADSHLKDTDIIITAQALLDPNSERLLTNDRDLVNSRVIKEEEERMRQAGLRNVLLKIVDGL